MAGNPSGVSCQITIVRAHNVEIPQRKGGGCLFVRMYLSTGTKTGKVRLNTQELLVHAVSDRSFGFDQSFSLDCKGMLGSVNVVFELRWRPTATSSSKLLGRAELPWKLASSSPKSHIEEWLPLTRSRTSSPSPALLVAMTVNHQATATETPQTQRRRRSCKEEWCGCSTDGCGNTCQDDYQLFALAASLEAF